jgi:hypothetical protein
MVGGIGGGTTERYYSLAAAAVRNGDSSTADSVFNDLAAVIPNDEAFHLAVSQRRLLRPRLARYYLLCFNNFYTGNKDSDLAPEELFGSFAVDYVLPRRASLAEWPRFSEDGIIQNALRLGNQVLVSKGTKLPAGGWTARRAALTKSGIAQSEMVGAFEEWSPESVSTLQNRMADAACDIWPLRPKQDVTA